MNVLTVRLPPALLNIIRKEAGEGRIATNALINKILQGYFDFYAFFPAAALIPFPRKAIVDLMGKLSDEELRQMARHLAEVEVPNIVTLVKGKYNLESFMEVFRIWLEVSDMPHREKMEGGSIVITVRHNMCKKFSLFLAEVVTVTLGRITKHEFEVKTQGDVLFLRLYGTQEL